MIDLGASSISSSLTPVGAIFAGVGAVFLLVGVGILIAGHRIRSRGETARGRIVDLSAADAGAAGHASGFTAADIPDLGLIYRPTVTFTTRDGQEVRATSRIGSNPAPGRVGDEVQVTYDARDPQRVSIDRARGHGTCGAAIFVSIGAVFLALGVGLLEAA